MKTAEQIDKNIFAIQMAQTNARLRIVEALKMLAKDITIYVDKNDAQIKSGNHLINIESRAGDIALAMRFVEKQKQLIEQGDVELMVLKNILEK